MKSSSHLAIIGSGASAIYLLKHLSDHAEELRGGLREISIFEKGGVAGMGMPYNPRTTDRYNMSNISPAELPELVVPFARWLRSLDDGRLDSLDLKREDIDEDAIYSRIALGQYLHAQYAALVAKLQNAGVMVRQYADCEITDIRDDPPRDVVRLILQDGSAAEFDLAVIATGHCWPEIDHPEHGYYASPWPMSKLLPADGEIYRHEVGTLGASLSAYDVVCSLSHRHGKFIKNGNELTYRPDPGTEKFSLAMHSADGLLPHLQYDQAEPMREIYRHVDRDGMLELIGGDGFLRIADYYKIVCRPALKTAFEKDGMSAMAANMDDPDFSLEDFVGTMAGKHDYDDPFEGMRREMKEARESVLNHRPIHWKETIDDLIYTLNYHAELMPAEDHLTLHTVVMPFLMNVIAAMPLESGATLLALHDAGKLKLVNGHAAVQDNQKAGKTRVEVEHEDGRSTLHYSIFVDCSGQKPLELEDFPFAGLVESGTVRRSRARFIDPDAEVPEEKRGHMFRDGKETFYHLGGIDIDAAFRVIGEDGKPNPRIHDIAYPHTSGVRPYSYGLQACDATSAILVRAWVESLGEATEEVEVAEITKIYEEERPAAATDADVEPPKKAG